MGFSWAQSCLAVSSLEYSCDCLSVCKVSASAWGSVQGQSGYADWRHCSGALQFVQFPAESQCGAVTQPFGETLAANHGTATRCAFCEHGSRGFGGSWLCHWLSILRIPLFAAVWLSRCRFTSDFSGCAIINCGKQAWQCHDEFEFLCYSLTHKIHWTGPVGGIYQPQELDRSRAGDHWIILPNRKLMNITGCLLE